MGIAGLPQGDGERDAMRRAILLLRCRVRWAGLAGRDDPLGLVAPSTAKPDR